MDVEQLNQQSLKSEEHQILGETEAAETPENNDLINQSIPEEFSQNYDNFVDVEDISTNPHHRQEILNEEKPLLVPSQLPELSENRQQYDPEAEAFEALQNLLFGSQVARLIRKFDTNLAKNSFNYNQDELNNIFNPLLSENLFNPFAQTEAEVIEVISPVIEQAIQKRFRQDEQAITSALAPLLAPSLETQIKQEPQVVAAALAPILDLIITKKTEQDQQSINSTLAPLLPGAISYAIENSPQEIAKALGPEMGAAIREQIRIDRRQISQALAPEIGTVIKDQIYLEQNSIVDALYPVIGSTISRYMAEAIREINEKISGAFSFRGIRRKINANFKGVSEAELIISEVMIFTVKAVFLIHKESGLLIAETQQSGRKRLESEMVAGMLTAIRSFVNDCIVPSGDVSELNEIEYGDSKIILEVAGYCYLAVVIKGQPNKSFIKELRQTLSNIVTDYGKYIKNFAGDSDAIPRSVQLLLKTLLDINVQENQKLNTSKAPTALLIVCGLILSLILIPWGIYQYYSRVYRSIEARTAEAWSNVPELAIYRLNAKVKGGYLNLTGQLPNQNLRNKATKIAQTEANRYNLELNNQIVAMEISLDFSEVSDEVDRITKALNEIEGVSITSDYAEGKVIIEGTVMDMTDSQKIVGKIEQVPGVESVISTIKLSPLKLKTRIYFDLGSAQLQSNYVETITQIQEFLSQYPQKYLRIIGHTDRTGDPVTNQRLATERADTVRDALVKQGVDARRLEVTGQTNPPQDVEYNQPLLLSRCVTFELF